MEGVFVLTVQLRGSVEERRERIKEEGRKRERGREREVRRRKRV